MISSFRDFSSKILEHNFFSYLKFNSNVSSDSRFENDAGKSHMRSIFRVKCFSFFNLPIVSGICEAVETISERYSTESGKKPILAEMTLSNESKP